LLKKQSQFDEGAIWHKLFIERRLWQNPALRGTKKQTQFKADARISIEKRHNRSE
jgi:hypothetical protein